MNISHVITSTQNELVKQMRSLQDKKGRMEYSAFLVEGEKCVNELITHAPQILRTLIVTTDHHNDIAHYVKAQGKLAVTVEPHVMRSICECKNPQNIAAVADLPATGSIKNGFIVALDDVQDPSNIGTIIRTADAAGCGGVVLSSTSADPFAPKAVRASMGSIFHLPVLRTDLSEYLESLHQKGYSVACADLRGSSDFLLNAENTCLVVGNEARGISEEILAMSSVNIRIPIYGKAESLNAAVAAGILIYKIRS